MTNARVIFAAVMLLLVVQALLLSIAMPLGMFDGA
jgi:hypothetical protein